MFRSKTIKAQLIKYNFCIICVISIFASTCSYITANKKSMELAKKSLEHDVENITYNYEVIYEEMFNIVLNCTERTTFKLNDYSTVENRMKAMSYSNLINDICAFASNGKYISKMAVFNDKGYIIEAGNSYGSSDDYERIINTDWFNTEMKKDIYYYQLNVVDSPFYLDNTKLIPIVRILNNNEGWILLCMSTKFFDDVLRENSDGKEIFVVTNTGKEIASIGEMNENEEITKMLLAKDDDSGFVEMKVNNKESLIFYNKESRSGILTYKILPLDCIVNDKILLFQTILIMFSACLIIGLVMSIIFTKKVKKPIDNLVRHIEVVASGNFIKDESLESEDEIGSIGKVINGMVGQIKELTEKQMNVEKQKSKLELKMLQAQINPHFLYNTLDSIRWIAIIQKNSGIVKVVTSLSSLLKNMAKGLNDKITLKKELELLNDYVTIEKVKYVELFDLIINIDDESLYNSKIIKMTLQPLIENAIFYGIEPTGKSGQIIIDVSSQNSDLYIVITDNGMGIASDKLEEILRCNNSNKGNHMSGIGLFNVNRRIKLTYGEEYGLTIESEIGKYTKIIIKTPLEY